MRGVLASIDATCPCVGRRTTLPRLGDSMGGVPLVGRRGLGKLLMQPGELQLADRDVLRST